LKAAFRDSAAVEGSRAARRFLLNYWPSSFDKTAHFGHFYRNWRFPRRIDESKAGDG
jgi:hypothetical protein